MILSDAEVRRFETASRALSNGRVPAHRRYQVDVDRADVMFRAGRLTLDEHNQIVDDALKKYSRDVAKLERVYDIACRRVWSLGS